ncbi:MAG TPA: hypothetical protein P5048_01650 [Chlamydiales bacterium]|nr:hypothetical protein [Chlamydiales bacterium]
MKINPSSDSQNNIPTPKSNSFNDSLYEIFQMIQKIRRCHHNPRSLKGRVKQIDISNQKIENVSENIFLNQQTPEVL